MKMAKKLLAVVLAGVLALSVLTGCGNAASTKSVADAMSVTKSIADAMSDMGKEDGEEYKADSKLNEKAKAIANKWVELENTKFDTEDEYVKAMKKSFMDIMGETYNDSMFSLQLRRRRAIMLRRRPTICSRLWIMSMMRSI